MPLTRQQRVRRVGILCLYCLRNLAFRNAGWGRGSLIRNEEFWINANGNFLDIAVLEWSKLFAEPRGRHAWHKVVTDEAQFRQGLLAATGLTQAEFDAYVDEVRTYRGRYVAHWDEDEEAQVPTLQVMRGTAAYLYEYLREHEDDGTFFEGAPPSAGRFYAQYLREGKAAYGQ
jgi:hypothetical protein